jgi:general stress protein 26
MTNSAQEGRQKVRAMIQKTGVGMLTTIDGDGQFVSRPMLALLLDDDPGVYFLTHTSSAKVGQIAAQSRVALTFIGPDSVYLSVVGRAGPLQDAALVAHLWNPTYRAWFPDGVGDPDVTVLRVAVDRADYWEAPTSRVVRLIEAVAAIVTHTPYETPKTTVEGP